MASISSKKREETRELILFKPQKIEDNDLEMDFPIDRQIYNDGKCYIHLIPGDIWTNVLQFLTVEELMNLWFTGNQQLLDCLGAKGGVRAFKLCAKFPDVDFFTWPEKFFNRLQGLRTLHVCLLDDPIARPERLLHGTRLTLLPSHLLDLELGFFDGITDACVDQLPTSITRLILPFNNSLTAEGFKHLSRNLVELDLSSNVHLKSDNLDLLPRNLQRLRANAKHLLPTPSLFDSLPKYIEEFKLKGDVQEWTLEDVSNLPKSITSVNFGNYEILKGSDIPVPLSLTLAPHLQVLNLSYYTQVSDQLFHFLPYGLVTLKLGWDQTNPPTWRDDSFLLLPRTLQTLTMMPWLISKGDISICRPFMPVHLTASMLLNLPDTLTTFAVWLLSHPAINMSAEDEYKMIPRSVTDLNIRIGIDERIPSSSALPPKLFKLVIRPRNTWDSRDGPTLLPSNISGIDFASGGYQSWDNDVNPAEPMFHVPAEKKVSSSTKWPPQLQSMRIRNLDVSAIPKTVTAIEIPSVCKWRNSFILRLPDGLKKLTISSDVYLSDECLPALPHGLRVLHLKGNSRINCEDHSLPKSLRSLRLGAVSRFNLKNLPFHLTSLTLEDATISDQSFKDLPPHITHLSFPATKRLTGACLQYLNDNVYYLNLHYAEFVDSDILQLPRSLHTLKVSRGSYDLTDASVKDFPRMLKELIIPGTCFTDRMIKDLPRSMTALCLNQASLVTPAGLPDLPKRIISIGFPSAYSSHVSNVKFSDITAILPRAQWIHQ